MRTPVIRRIRRLTAIVQGSVFLMAAASIPLEPPGEHKWTNVLFAIGVSLTLVVMVLMLLEMYLDRRRAPGAEDDEEV